MQTSLFDKGGKKRKKGDDPIMAVLPKASPGKYLRQAILDLRAEVEDGVSCQCCGKLCKVYKRKLHYEMAAFLVAMVRVHGVTGDWVDIRKLRIRGKPYQRGDYAYLQHWGFLKHKPNDTDSSVRDSGFWMPTKKGIMFVKNQISAVSHVHTYNNRVVGQSKKLVSIRKALGSKFSLEELMAGKE